MLLWATSFVIILQINIIFGGSQQFIIKNKKSGLVLGAQFETPIVLKPWAKENTQLWTLEWAGPNRTLHYFIHNVGMKDRVLDASPETKEVLTWGKHGGPNQVWSLQPSERITRFEVEYYPDHVMVHKDDKVEMYELESKPEDGSDEWLLIVVPS